MRGASLLLLLQAAVAVSSGDPVTTAPSSLPAVTAGPNAVVRTTHTQTQKGPELTVNYHAGH